jgi:hypothetical protein
MDRPFNKPVHSPDQGGTMKYLKILGLTVVAATALMAVMGVSSAAANQSTVICKKNETPCALANQYPAGTHFEASLVPGTHATLKGNVTVTCKKSTVTGFTRSGTANPLHGEITVLTFTECEGCTKVTSLNLPYTATVTKTGPGVGTFTAEPRAGGGNPGAKLENCPFGVSCTASTPSITLDISNTAGGTPRVKAVNETLNMAGFGCGTTATWNAEYEITKPHPSFISS